MEELGIGISAKQPQILKEGEGVVPQAPEPTVSRDSSTTAPIVQRPFDAVVQYSPPSDSGMIGSSFMEEAMRIKKEEQTYTENELRVEPHFIQASRNIVKFRDPDNFPFMSDDDVMSTALDYIGQVNYNIPAAVNATFEYDDADLETMSSMAYLIEAYEAKEIDAKGFGRVAVGLATDPSTYASIGSMGFATGAQVAAKQTVKETFKKFFTNRMALLSMESAAYSGGGTALYNELGQDVNLRKDMGAGEIALATAIGAAVPKGLQKAGQGVVKGVGNFMNRMETEVLPAMAGGGTPERDMIVQHNLSQANLMHAEEMGGIPVPSIAVANKNMPLEGYGEITLLGDKGLVTPSKDTKAYGADIYSPRYPQVTYNTTPAQDSKMKTTLQPFTEMVGDTGYRNIESVNDLSSNTAFLAKVLDDNGIKIPTQKIKVKPGAIGDAKKYYKQFYGKQLDTHDMKSNEEFKNSVLAELIDKAPDLAESISDEGLDNMARAKVRELNVLNTQVANKGKIDDYETKNSIRNLISKKKLWREVDTSAKQFFKYHDVPEVLYNGTNNLGQPKYIPHNMGNVIKKMKKDLVGGENFPTQAGGKLRAKFTPQFKNIKEIQNNRSKLVSEADFELAKEEAANEAFDIASKLEAYYKYDTNNFSYNDDVMNMIGESADTSLERELKDYGFESVPDEIINQIEDFTTALKHMPTEYFEVNILRAVDAGEFKVAVVPKGTSRKTTDLLKKKGLKVKVYNDKDRAKVIKESADKEGILFMHPAATGGAITASALATQGEDNEDRN